jgi:hypothetical protein
MFNCKKLLSLALAGAMAASLGTSAFAASENTTNRSLKVTAAYQAVTINVVVPTTGTVVINPYALPVSIGTDTSDKKVEISEQIVTKPMAIKSQAGIGLDMSITTTTAVTGNLKLATVNDGDTANNAEITMYIEPTTLSGDKDAVSDGKIAETYKTLCTSEDAGWGTAKDAYGQDAYTKALSVGSTTTKEKTITLAPAKTDDDTGAFEEYKSGCVALIGFEGKCVTDPKTAWTTKDGVTCTIAFTFTPTSDTLQNSGE